MRARARSVGFVICVNNADYPASLELHKVYRVLPDREAEREGDLRVVDESGEDYLYPAAYFLPVRFGDRVARALKQSYSRTRQPVL